jgi:hypothetical protein
MARVVRAPSSSTGGSYSLHPFAAVRSPRASTGAGRVLRGAGTAPNLARTRAQARRAPDSPDLAAQALAMHAVRRPSPALPAAAAAAAAPASSSSSSSSSSAASGGAAASSNASSVNRLSGGSSNLAAMGARSLLRQSR